MSYLDDIADAVRAHVPRSLVPDGDTALLFRLYAVLLLAKGEGVTTEDVHNAWSAWMQSERADHPALRPFDELDAATQDSDAPYADAIRAACRELQAS